jgi:anti-sigma-K factor RskA
MNDRDHVLDLTAAYALGAATTDEARAVQAHCATCAACASDLAEMSGLAATLPLACDPVSPSSELRRRILAVARGDASAGSFLRNLSRRSYAPPASWWAAAAAAVLVTAAGVGGMAFMDHQAMVRQMDALHGELAANQGAIRELAAGRVWDMSGGTKAHWWHCTVVQPPKQAQAMLVASMPPTPKGMTFQAWIIHGGKLHDAGTVPAGTISMMHMPMPVQKGDIIAFSVEPVGGSPTPTMPFAMRQALD